MAYRKIASLVLSKDRLVIPVDNKNCYPDVSISTKIKYLVDCQYTDILVAIKDDVSLKDIPRPLDTAFSICINSEELHLAEKLFKDVCSKIFIRVDNIQNLNRVKKRLSYLNDIYGASSLGAMFHLKSDIDESTFDAHIRNLCGYFSEITIINHEMRTQLIADEFLEILAKIKSEFGIEVNIICEIDDSTSSRLLELKLNSVNQFQIFTKWDHL